MGQFKNAPPKKLRFLDFQKYHYLYQNYHRNLKNNHNNDNDINDNINTNVGYNDGNNENAKRFARAPREIPPPFTPLSKYNDNNNKKDSNI